MELATSDPANPRPVNRLRRLFFRARPRLGHRRRRVGGAGRRQCPRSDPASYPTSPATYTVVNAPASTQTTWPPLEYGLDDPRTTSGSDGCMPAGLMQYRRRVNQLDFEGDMATHTSALLLRPMVLLACLAKPQMHGSTPSRISCAENSVSRPDVSPRRLACGFVAGTGPCVCWARRECGCARRCPSG